MSGSEITFTSHEHGDSVFHALANRLGRFVLENEIRIGRIKGIGGYADVYDAMMSTAEPGGWKKVAVKRFRVILENDETFAESLKREVLIWNQLQHANVLPLLGIAVIDGIPCTVSDWMENGTMDTYLKSHEDVNILELVREIASGLEYIHDRNVVHSDLKSDNVLITHDGHPVLSDFGISRLLIDSVTIAGTTSLRGNARWMAPELIVPPAGSPSQLHMKATDVWAFGMLVYQVLCKRLPFHELHNDAQVIASIMKGDLPTKPECVGSEEDDLHMLWNCCCECWDRDPARRPSISEIREHLQAGRFKNSLSEAWIADAPMLLSWLSPSGQFLATRTDDARTMSLLETRTMSRCGPDLIVDHEVGAVAWSSTEDTIVTRAADGILRNLSNVFESATIIVQSTQKHEYASIEYSPDDRLIASIGYEKAKLWDASNLSLLWESSGYLCHSVAFHPLEHNFFVIRGFSVVNANVEDLGTIASTKRKIDFWANRLVFDPSGDTCAASTRQGVKILDAKTFAVKTEISCSVVVGMRYTPSGKYLLLILKAKIML